MTGPAIPVGFERIEGVLLVLLVVGFVFWTLIRKFSRSRPGLAIATPIAVGFGLRLAAIAGISATGLETTLRGGDENTFLALGRLLAANPISHNYLPHSGYQLQTILFAFEIKLGFLTVGAMRIVQVGLALTGVILVVTAVYDLAGRQSSRLTAWILALEPGSLFFNSALHKEPNMELAAGLVVFGGAMFWRRLDVRAVLICALGGAIAVETRSYAGWFLVAAAVLTLLHAALRNLDRPMRAMPVIYAVAAIGFIATPVLLQASSKKNLQNLQQSQTANAQAIGTGTGTSNSDNLALEQVNFSTRGQIFQHLPQRMLDLTLRPYPWQLGDTSQRFGALGTLFAYVILFLLIRYAWISRGAVFPRAGPVLYPLLFMLVAYSLSVGNAGTGFRYRTHLVTLAVAAMTILRQEAFERRAAHARTGPDPEAPPSRVASGIAASV